MFKTIACAALAAALTSTAASAQDMVYWPAPLAATQTVGMSYFPVGTPLKLVTRTEVSTKTNKPGDRFYLSVAEDLTYRGQVVVPAGSVAVGQVADLQRNGHLGKKGKLGVRLLYVQTPSGPVRLSGRGYDEGKSGTVASVATLALAPIAVAWAGVFIHGTSARLPSGSGVQGYFAEDMRFAVQPRPIRAAMNEVLPDSPHPVVTADAAGSIPVGYLDASRAQGSPTARR